jgi:hypothetical protein
MFVVGTLTVIGAVVAIGRIDGDWADVGAVALILAILALLMVTIARQLGDRLDRGRARARGARWAGVSALGVRHDGRQMLAAADHVARIG